MPSAPLALPFIRPCRFHAPAFTPPPPPLALLSQRSITDRPTDAVAAAHLDGGDGEQCNEYYRAAVDDGNTTEDDDTTANVPNPCSEGGKGE